MRVLTVTALAAVTIAATFLPGAAASHTMNGSVDVNGSIRGPSSQQAPGTHDFTVSDTADLHNFHLTGPGVNEATGVEATGTFSWPGLAFSVGIYRFQCDVHPTINGSFTVGAPSPPPPPPSPPPVVTRLRGTVGPGATIKVTNTRGIRVRSVVAGRYLLVISDRTTADNFHFTGPGVNRKTGVKGRGTFRWTLRLKPGAHRYRSDAHARLRGTLTVRRAG